jgi:molybdenum cofactor biosynthesis protein B
VLTVSDTRRGREDTSGALIEYALRRAGHRVASRDWVRDDASAIRRAAKAQLARPATDVVILTGGTGVAPRDVTPEALAPLVEKRLDGFGERFRARSWEQVGGAAWLSRAFAGIASGRLLVALPGSVRAVELAMNELVVPELVHIVRLLGRFQPEE